MKCYSRLAAAILFFAMSCFGSPESDAKAKLSELQGKLTVCKAQLDAIEKQLLRAVSQGTVVGEAGDVVPYTVLAERGVEARKCVDALTAEIAKLEGFIKSLTTIQEGKKADPKKGHPSPDLPFLKQAIEELRKEHLSQRSRADRLTAEARRRAANRAKGK